MKIALQLNCLPEETVLNWQQAKDFFTTATNSLKTARQEFIDTSSETVQIAIASSVSNWLQAHPVVFRAFNTIIWAIDHPVISFVVIILTIAIALSIFKALNRLLEMVGLSLIKAPFKLIEAGFKLSPLGSLGIRQKFNHKNISDKNVFIVAPHSSQQRLAEIAQRLQLLQLEQDELLQEATTILARHNNH